MKSPKPIEINDVKVFILDVDEQSPHSISQNEIYKDFQQRGFPTFWLMRTDAFLINSVDRAHCYIVPEFCGSVFEHLKEINCRIFGSNLVRYCMQNKVGLPRWSHPLYSFSLSGAILTFSGVDAAIKVAKEMDIPIISLDELKSAWKKSTAGDVDVCKDLFAQSEMNTHSAPLDPFSNVEEPIIDEQVPVNDAHELEQPSTSIYAEFSKLVSEPVESLSKMSFRLQFFDDKELQDATNLVTPLKGKIVTSDSEFADITLTPLLIKPSADMSVIGSSTLCSIFWLRKCIAEGIVFDPKSDPLYIPFLVNDGYSDIFKGCIVALSGLSALERDAVQNNITRKRRENLVPNTHVVVTKENEKSTTARLWNIFALNCSWIIECVSKQQRCAEENAQFDARSNETYTRSDDIWNHNAVMGPSSVHPEDFDSNHEIRSNNLDPEEHLSNANVSPEQADVASVFPEPSDFDQIPNRDTALDSVCNNHSGEMTMTSRNYRMDEQMSNNQEPMNNAEVQNAPGPETGKNQHVSGPEAVPLENNWEISQPVYKLKFADDVVKQMNKNIQELPSQQDSDSFNERKIRHALKVAVAKSAGHILGNNITDTILTQEDGWLAKPASQLRSQPPSTAIPNSIMDTIRSNIPKGRERRTNAAQAEVMKRPSRVLRNSRNNKDPPIPKRSSPPSVTVLTSPMKKRTAKK
ncbi:DNA topoisomerase 2-binding protein 1 [Ditylenchus destructor]|nr:DNA topoisomerase 2-binding protein 1 [Ditylenchus destructor]